MRQFCPSVCEKDSAGSKPKQKESKNLEFVQKLHREDDPQFDMSARPCPSLSQSGLGRVNVLWFAKALRIHGQSGSSLWFELP